MLLPYYIASMNIEHAYYEITGQYEPFDGICLVDTFQLAEARQQDFFTTENTARVRQQKQAPIFVVIGNPPYNVGQVNENDNNKNRKYEEVDGWVRDTYAFDSKATLKNALFDPYVKAICWAARRIGDEGIVAFVTNNGFLDNIAFDGMRKHLAQDFSKLYVLDLGGNIRKNPGKTQNVFGIKVGVSINLFVKSSSQETEILYAHVSDELTKQQKLDYLLKNRLHQIDWQIIHPNEKNIWLTKDLHSEFENFIPLGTKKTKAASREVEGVIFKVFCRGVCSNGDAYVYNFDSVELKEIAQGMVSC
jgi:predicted helicase